MTLHEQVTDILASAVEAQECAGISVLVRRCGEEMLYTQAGMSDVASGRLIHRDSIFRLYSQSKPITAAAVMLLAERGQIELMDGVDRYLPGFRNARVVDKQGTIRPATRAPWLMELLGIRRASATPTATRRGSTPQRCSTKQRRKSLRAAACRQWSSATAWGSSRCPSSRARTGATPPARTFSARWWRSSAECASASSSARIF